MSAQIIDFYSYANIPPLPAGEGRNEELQKPRTARFRNGDFVDVYMNSGVYKGVVCQRLKVGAGHGGEPAYLVQTDHARMFVTESRLEHQ
jgi:hypothetical protein